ncbi:MAG: MFS transporter, partial [Rhodospirillaceae bacterium]|nr:MFS transporter [Rhodospirillaceae bacterium]
MASVISFPRRELQAVGLIGFAHMLSHVYPLALAPLLIPITKSLEMSTVEWGTALAVFAITTGVLQTPMGFLVERIGGRKVLIGGLLLFSAAFFLIGWQANSFWQLLVLMAIAGIGNAVFHPADYSLISSSVDEERLGRAYSIHTFVGHVGFLVGPVLAAALEPFIGWRGAMMAMGGIGLVMTLALVLFAHLINEGTKVKKKDSMADSLRDLLTSRPVMLFFLFYMGASMANFGVTQFSVAAFENMEGGSRAAGVVALTAYQVATLLLVLPGGILADRTVRYDAILIIGFSVSALMVFLAGTNLLPFWLVVICLAVGGAMRGGANASRDVAVRHVASHLPIGTVFGFVSTGFLVGQAVAGPIYGYLVDNYPPHIIFYTSAA